MLTKVCVCVHSGETDSWQAHSQMWRHMTCLSDDYLCFHTWLNYDNSSVITHISLSSPDFTRIAWIQPGSTHTTLTRETGQQLPQCDTGCKFKYFTQILFMHSSDTLVQSDYIAFPQNQTLTLALQVSCSTVWTTVKKSCSDHLIFWEFKEKCLSWYWEPLISDVFSVQIMVWCFFFFSAQISKYS